MVIPKIISVCPNANNNLDLVFDGEIHKIFDVTPYIKGDWFGLLASKQYFSTVHIVENGFGIEWKDGQDIAPHELFENSISV